MQREGRKWKTRNIKHPAEEPEKDALNYTAPLCCFSDFYKKFGLRGLIIDSQLIMSNTQM